MCCHIGTSARPGCRFHYCRRHRTDRPVRPALRPRNTSDAPHAGMAIESHATAIASHISAALSPQPQEKLAKKNLPKTCQEKTCQEKTCHVGQISCICSPSQELSPRRRTGRGLFESD